MAQSVPPGEDALDPARGAPLCLPTGVRGLDTVLGGGVPSESFFLLQGDVGTGKTTLALQFLREGVRRGERCVFLTLGASERELRRIAASHGWTLDGIEIRNLPLEQLMHPHQTVFPAQSVELANLTDWLHEVVREAEPDRLVLDAINHFRSLAGSAGRFRQEAIALRRFFLELTGVALVIDLDEATTNDNVLRSLSDGILKLERLEQEYGGQRFRLQVVKLRATRFHGGFHDFAIHTGGMRVYPRLMPAASRQRASWTRLQSGSAELDTLLGGGLETGSACMLVGPSGVGKSTLCTLYAHAVSAPAAGADGRAAPLEGAAVFLFEERLDTFFKRSAGVGLELESALETKRLTVEQINPGTVSPGEFAVRVIEAVEAGARLVVIDSLTGYLNAMSQERLLISQLHDLLTFLAQRDVLALYTIEQHGLLGDETHTPLKVSDMADTVLRLDYFRDPQGATRKALSVVKKRYGDHEKGWRQLHIRPGAVTVGSTSLPPPGSVRSGVMGAVPTAAPEGS